MLPLFLVSKYMTTMNVYSAVSNLRSTLVPCRIDLNEALTIVLGIKRTVFTGIDL